MRSRAIALVLLVALPLAAQDRKDPAAVKLPFNSLAKAKAGDWAVYLRRETEDGKTRPATLVEWTVDKVDEKSVTAKLNDRARTFQLASGDTLGELFDFGAGTTIGGWSVEDAKVEVCGRELAAKKASFDVLDGAKRFGYVVWLAQDVRGWGVARLRIETERVTYDFEGDATRTKYAEEWELAGLGNGKNVEWGRTADALRAELEK